MKLLLEHRAVRYLLFLGVSACIHLFFVFFAIRYPLFRGDQLSFEDDEIIPLADEDVALSEKNIALEQAFDEWEASSLSPLRTKRCVVSPSLQESCLLKEAQFAEKEFSSSDFIERGKFELPLEMKELAYEKDPKELLPLFSPERRSWVFQKSNPVEDPLQGRSFIAPFHFTAKALPFFEKDLEIQPFSGKEERMIALIPDQFHIDAKLAPPTIESEPIEQGAFLSYAPQQLSLQDYRFPLLPEVVDWSDRFALHLKTKKLSDGTYFFSLEVDPSSYHLKPFKMGTSYHFIIDRSAPLKKQAFDAFKKSVARALRHVSKQDRFNITFFDQKKESLSDTFLEVTQGNIEKALRFLQKGEQSGYGSTGDLYQGVLEMVEGVNSFEESCNIILFSDGKYHKKKEKKFQAIRELVKKKAIGVNLHTAAVGKGNDLQMLGLISTLSGGRMVHSDTFAAFPRKVSKLILDTSYPIVKEVEISFSDTTIPLKMSRNHFPDLQATHPFTIYGTAPNPTDFLITLTGKNGSELVTIKKQVHWSSHLPTDKVTPQDERVFISQNNSLRYLEEGSFSLQ